MHPMIAERLFARVLEDHRAGRLTEAEAGCRALLAAVPRHAQALGLSGLIHCEDGDQDTAALLIDEALAIAPDEALFHRNLGRVEEARQRAGAAEAAYGRAILLRPDFDEAFSRLGALQAREGRLAGAAINLRRALLISPDGPTANLAAALLVLADAAAGSMSAEERAESWMTLGQAFRRQERLHEALAAFERALSLNPAHPAALGVWLATLDEVAPPPLDEAEATAGAAALLAVGARLFEGGDEEKAIIVYRRFLGFTTKRAHYPGHPPRLVTVRPAAAVCPERGWPYQTIAAASAIHVVADDDGAGAGPGVSATATAYTYDLPEVFLAFAEDAVLVPKLHAPLVGGDTLLVDGFNTNSRASLPLLAHIVWHSQAERMLLDLPEPGVWIEEESVLLGGGPNWSHGVLDWLSKLVALERCPALAGLPVLIDPATPRSILDLAEMLGLARERMRPLPHEGGVVAGRRLWLPSLTHHYQFTSPLHLDFLRRRLAGALAEGRARKRRRLFLSRRQAGYRALLNEAEVLAALAPFGVEAVVPEDFPMAEQIRLFASAELIIGPLGGGSAAMVFAAPGAGFVELTHDNMILSQYAILCGLLGQRFRRIVGTARGRRGFYTFNHDFTVSPDAVAAAVQGLLDRSPAL